MKVQEVILRAMVKKITWCRRQRLSGSATGPLRRWPERYEEFGYRSRTQIAMFR